MYPSSFVQHSKRTINNAKMIINRKGVVISVNKIFKFRYSLSTFTKFRKRKDRYADKKSYKHYFSIGKFYED